VNKHEKAQTNSKKYLTNESHHKYEDMYKYINFYSFVLIFYHHIIIINNYYYIYYYNLIYIIIYYI